MKRILFIKTVIDTLEEYLRKFGFDTIVVSVSRVLGMDFGYFNIRNHDKIISNFKNYIFNFTNFKRKANISRMNLNI